MASSGAVCAHEERENRADKTPRYPKAIGSKTKTGDGRIVIISLAAKHALPQAIVLPCVPEPRGGGLMPSLHDATSVPS